MILLVVFVDVPRNSRVSSFSGKVTPIELLLIAAGLRISLVPLVDALFGRVFNFRGSSVGLLGVGGDS